MISEILEDPKARSQDQKTSVQLEHRGSLQGLVGFSTEAPLSVLQA